MLITAEQISEKLKANNIVISGVLHIGAHECEEFNDYLNEGVDPQAIYWIDAMEDKVVKMNQRGIPNVYFQAIDLQEGEVEFKITGNGQSSSLLEMGTHLKYYPHIHVVRTEKVRTDTLKNWIEKNGIPIKNCNFWNLDIQGKELDALKSAEHYIQHANAIYAEINVEEVYKGCGLVEDLDVFLKEKGFERYKTAMTGAGWGDALYLRV